MDKKAKSTLIYAIAGILLGYLSASNGKNIILIGIILLAILSQIVSKSLGKKDFKWIITNGLWPGLATWFAVWVILINL